MDVPQHKLRRPVNIAAERAVLAGLCQFPEIHVECAEIVTPDCFTTEINQKIFKCISDILNDGTGVDVPSLVARGSMYGFDIAKNKENIDYVKALFSFGIKSENVVKNAAIIRKLDLARKEQNICSAAFKDLSNVTGEEPLSEILAKLEVPVFDFGMSINTEKTQKTDLISVGVKEYIEAIKANPSKNIGIPSPWPIYNAAIGNGRRKGGVYLIAARPKRGKSSLSVNDGLYVSKLGIKVLYLDTEMDKEGQWPRILANLASIDSSEIEKGGFASNDFKSSKIDEAIRKLETLPFYYRKISGLPFTEIISIIRRWVVKEVGTTDGVTNDCLIIYDYFKIMDTEALKDMKEYQAMGFQIQALCDFCNQYKVPCSAYVQVNREGDDGASSVNLSQSDRLLWLCSSVAILERKSPEEIAENPKSGNMKLVIPGDQRYGPGLDDGDWLNLNFDKAKTQITEAGTRFVKNIDTGFEVNESELQRD